MSHLIFNDDGKKRYQSVTATVSWQGYDAMSTFDFTLTGYGADKTEAEYHLRRAMKDQLKAMEEI